MYTINHYHVLKYSPFLIFLLDSQSRKGVLKAEHVPSAGNNPLPDPAVVAGAAAAAATTTTESSATLPHIGASIAAVTGTPLTPTVPDPAPVTASTSAAKIIVAKKANFSSLSASTEDTYNDFNFWKIPPQIIEDEY